MEVDPHLQHILEQDLDIGVSKTHFYDITWNEKERQLYDEKDEFLKQQQQKEADLIGLQNYLRSQNLPNTTGFVFEEDTGEWIYRAENASRKFLEPSLLPPLEFNSVQSFGFTSFNLNNTSNGTNNQTIPNQQHQQQPFYENQRPDVFNQSSFVNNMTEYREPSSNQLQHHEQVDFGYQASIDDINAAGSSVASNYNDPRFFFCHPSALEDTSIFNIPEEAVASSLPQTAYKQQHEEEQLQQQQQQQQSVLQEPQQEQMDENSLESLVANFTLPPLFMSQKSFENEVDKLIDDQAELNKLVETFNCTILNDTLDEKLKFNGTTTHQQQQQQQSQLIEECQPSQQRDLSNVLIKANVTLNSDVAPFNDEFLACFEENYKSIEGSLGQQNGDYAFEAYLNQTNQVNGNSSINMNDFDLNQIMSSQNITLTASASLNENASENRNVFFANKANSSTIYEQNYAASSSILNNSSSTSTTNDDSAHFYDAKVMKT